MTTSRMSNFRENNINSIELKLENYEGIINEN